MSQSNTDLQVFNPSTGEILALDAPTVDLANVLADIRAYESRLKELKAELQREILRRMDESASWGGAQWKLDGMQLAGQSPAPEESWDGAELRGRLLELVEDGALTIQAVDAAVEQVISFKVRKAGVQALRKLGGRVAAYVDSCCFTSEPQRYISVRRG